MKTQLAHVTTVIGCAWFLTALAVRLPAAEVTVRTSSELQASLADLKDGTRLKIASGEFPGGYHVSGVKDLVIEPLDPAQPPVFRGGSSGWHFSRCDRLTLRGIRVTGQKVNGLNLDDGGKADQPVEGILIENVEVSDIGPQGNHDAIKCSGLNKLTIRNCRISGWGGQGIDFVGCHDSLITGCHFEGKDGFSASAGIQLKGGTSQVVVEKCRFIHGGERPINAGGSTGLPFFRPPGALYEAKELIIRNNTIEGSSCAVAFVGVDGAEFSDNTVLFPQRWLFRILQETREPGFAPCRKVLIKNNRFVFRRADLRSDVNVGEGTEPGSFVFEGNRWFAEDRPSASKPNLPAQETGAVYGTDPR
ncbi:MAG: right-handed parallel beta-helix repeat-containing protein [Verrucomicrobiaceae bacterium]|nr:right-handed parallel beta-helix repeat-containing protein [Verrucomicrobiaceae bacterium]